MSFKHPAAWALSLSLSLMLLGTASAQSGSGPIDQDPGQVADFDGFNVDEHLQSLPPTAKAAFMEQLRIVESSGVPPEVLSFFRSVPIVVDPAQRRQPGEFAIRDGRAAVFVQDRPMAPNRPIVLHELLHAYHVKIMRTDGAKITQAYRQAVRSGAYPDDYKAAHFLENEREYFAVIGSIYLFGPIQQPPFNCGVTRQNAPEILEVMERNFGPHVCK